MQFKCNGVWSRMTEIRASWWPISVTAWSIQSPHRAAAGNKAPGRLADSDFPWQPTVAEVDTPRTPSGGTDELTCAEHPKGSADKKTELVHSLEPHSPEPVDRLYRTESVAGCRIHRGCDLRRDSHPD